MIGYGFLGMAPLVLTSLPAIVVTRVGVGITEAAIMTCATTLIVDYFEGEARNRWLGFQTIGSALAAAGRWGRSAGGPRSGSTPAPSCWRSWSAG